MDKGLKIADALWFRADGELFFTAPGAGSRFRRRSQLLPDWGDEPPVGPPRAASGGGRKPFASEFDWNDLREHPRRPAAQLVEFAIGDHFYSEAMRDISVGGMFIETTLELVIGQEVAISIPFSDGRAPVRVRGEVVRVTGDGIGIRFLREGKTTRGGA
jgi:Tfp pilus assembly protein PilZ